MDKISVVNPGSGFGIAVAAMAVSTKAFINRRGNFLASKSGNVVSKVMLGVVGIVGAFNAHAAIVHNQDTIIQGSVCVGQDCATSESFGFDTIRVKENNLRINFQDTSASASFPSNDWRIVINDTGNGGASYFAIEDSTAGRVPFKIAAGAPSDSLTVDAAGDVGIGISNAVVELHIRDGDSPTIRLEQDGSSGFTPKTYDIAANETNFFVRSGGNLPFRIMNDAPENALKVMASGNVGIGEQSETADGSLHISRGGTAPASVVLEQTASEVKWEIKANEKTGRLTFKDLNGDTTPFKFAPTAAENLFRVGIDATDIVDINGNLDISGNLTIGGQCTEADGACADYVFEPGYQLLSLGALEAFIQENRHLPNVPSASHMMKNGVNLAHISGRLLEKVEELTLYTLQQEDTIAALTDRLGALERVTE